MIKGKARDEVIVTVTNGKGRMPSLKGRLSEDQIRAIAGYVSGLQ